MTAADNLKLINARIEKTARKWNIDPRKIEIVAVSKQQPGERVLEALEAGQRIFGENRVSEAIARWDGASGFRKKYPDIELHMIGPLQTNKVDDAVRLFDVLHTLDREKLALAVKQAMDKQGKSLSVLIQVNTGDEQQKAGIAPENLGTLLDYCRNIGLPVDGLMCLPPVDEPPGLHFAFLNELAQKYNLPKLSMGMSGDFEKAIPFSPAYLRLGSVIFGAREY